MASTDFEQVNPTIASQETDAGYQADSTTTGGLVSNQIVGHTWLNKFAYQASTALKALALALVGKNYSPVDGSSPFQAASAPSAAVTALAAVFANLLTRNDTYAPTRVTLGGNVGITSGVQTTVLTTSFTFPSAAGNYRADIRYALWATLGANVMAAQVVDATNSIAYAPCCRDSNGAGYECLNGSELSGHLYAAGATVTFNLVVLTNASETVTVVSGLLSPSPNPPTFLAIVPVVSN